MTVLEKQQPRGKSWLVGLGWLLVILLAVGPRIVDLNIFYARDELAIWPWADQFTLAVWAGDPAGTLTTSDYPGIPLFWTQTLFLTLKYNLPALFPQTAVPLDQLSQNRSIELLAERRLAAALLVSLQVMAAVWLVRRLFGWPSALVSAILLGLDPFSLSEARLLRLEMTSALFVCLSVLAYLLYLRCRRISWLLLSGAMAGLGVSAKTSAGLIVPYVWILLALDFLLGSSRDWLQKFKRLSLNGLVWVGGAIVAFWLIWPAMWVKPLEALQYIFVTGFSQAANRSVWGDKVFFWGQIVDGGDPGPWFYPVALAFRTTPLLWVGTASALIFLAVLVWRKPAKAPGRDGSGIESTAEADVWGWPWRVVGLSLLLLYLIVVTVELSLVISKVDRFLILIFPELNILSALGLTAMAAWIVSYASRLTSVFSPLSSRVSRLTPYVSMLVLSLIILSLQLSITLPVHPYYFTYWNPWLGGGRAAMDLLPIGAGEGIDLAMNFLNEQPDAAAKTLVCGASQPWCARIFKGKTDRSADYVDGRWVQADYATFYISQLQRQIDPPEVVNFFKQQPPLYRVNLQGVDYVWVYAVPEMAHYAGRSNDLAGLGRLLGYNLSSPDPTPPTGAVTARPGEAVELKVWWTNFGAGVDNLVVRWLDETGYEWGRARVVPLPEYAAIAPAERAIVVGTTALTVPLGTPPGLYFLRIGIVAPGEERLLGEFTLPDEANKLVVAPGQIVTEPELLRITTLASQTLAPEVRLLGYDPPAQALTPSAPTWLALYWQATAPPPDYQVTLSLVDSAGREATRWQGQPGHGHYPTQNWRTGEIVKDVWALQVPADTPVGNYSLEISLSNPNQPQIPNPKSRAKGPLWEIQNLEVLPQPVRYTVPDMQTEVQVNFGQQLTLLGYDLYFDAGGAAGGRLAPVFYWRSQTDFAGAFDLWLTLRAADTAQVIKEWRVPLGAGDQKALWKVGEVVETGYRLDTGGLNNGRYHLDIALKAHHSDHFEPVKAAAGSETTFTRIENIQDRLVVRVGGQ